MAVAFSDEWARAWCRSLNDNEPYRTAAATWEGSVLLRLRPVPTAAGAAPSEVFLDLHHGSCRAGRVATPEDAASATFVFEADEDVWKSLLRSQSNPIMALMTGRLELTRGEMGRLLPFAGAAKELLHLVTLIETEFADD